MTSLDDEARDALAVAESIIVDLVAACRKAKTCAISPAVSDLIDRALLRAKRGK